MKERDGEKEEKRGRRFERKRRQERKREKAGGRERKWMKKEREGGALERKRKREGEEMELRERKREKKKERNKIERDEGKDDGVGGIKRDGRREGCSEKGGGRDRGREAVSQTQEEAWLILVHLSDF